MVENAGTISFLGGVEIKSETGQAGKRTIIPIFPTKILTDSSGLFNTLCVECVLVPYLSVVCGCIFTHHQKSQHKIFMCAPNKVVRDAQVQ